MRFAAGCHFAVTPVRQASTIRSQAYTIPPTLYTEHGARVAHQNREGQAAQPGPPRARPDRGGRARARGREGLRHGAASDRRGARRHEQPDDRSDRGPYPPSRRRPGQGRRAGARRRGTDRGGAGLSEVKAASMNGMSASGHRHVFLGEGHDKNERRTWAVIGLCTVMMAAEIVGGLLSGSIALVADGLHMSTHASALLLAALAYRYARRHADDPRFSFGTGKFGDLAGFSSAIVLLMIAVLIGYEAVARLIAPVPISFNEAIPIAALGLIVNIVSALL